MSHATLVGSVELHVAQGARGDSASTGQRMAATMLLGIQLKVAWVGTGGWYCSAAAALSLVGTRQWG